MRPILFLSLLWPTLLPADPIREGLGLGTSTSHSYGARSIFTNPAALGFQSELNGNQFLSSFTYATNQGFTDEADISLSWGAFGLGFEALSTPAGHYERYSLGFGASLTPWLFLGTRLGVVRNHPTDPNYTALDAGLQLRPSSFFSIGFTANRRIGRSYLFVGGVTLRPFDRIELGFDADSQKAYQGTLALRLFPGLRVTAGYHSDYRYLAGLQWNLSETSFRTTAEPDSSSKALVIGADWSALPKKDSRQPATAAKIVVPGNMSESGSRGSVFHSAEPAFYQLIEQLDRIGASSHIPMVLIKLEHFPLGLAAAEEFADALKRLREKGIMTEIFLKNAGLKEYMIASQCHRIHLESAGEIRILSPRAERYFLKGTLEKIGVEPEFLAHGKYKTAPEMFTRRESSETSQEVIYDQLDQVEQKVSTIIFRFRKNLVDQWKPILERAVFSAQDALSLRLIEAIDSFEPMIEKLEKGVRVSSRLEYEEDTLNLPSRIAILPVEGDILDKRFRGLALGGHRIATPTSFSARMKAAMGDPRTRAIVVRVNSPGGEVLASQEIADNIARHGNEKPIVVSMGDAAASGGYMVSAPAKRIFANSLTITGSIGVFLGKFNLKEIYKKIDLRKEILTRSSYPGLLSEDRPWSPSEKEIMQRRLNQYYSDFKSYVSKSRGLSSEKVEESAQGRVWLGTQGVERKLADEIGGLREAVLYASKIAGSLTPIPEVWFPQEESSLFGELFEGPFGKSPLFDDPLVADLLWISALAQNRYFYLSDLKTFE